MEATEKKVHYVAFWTHELLDLIKHLETTNFQNQDLIDRAKEFVTNQES